MPNDAFYDAVLSRAKVHLNRAWDAFYEDPKLGVERAEWQRPQRTPADLGRCP